MSVHRGGGPDRAPLPVKEQPPPPPYDYDPDREEEDEEEALGRQEDYKPCAIRYITALSRSAGAVTIIILWLFTGLLLRDLERYRYAPWYLMGVSILLTFFETIWMVNKCVIACMRQDGCCCSFWRFLVWIDVWRKTILYVAFAIPCFLQDIVTTETIVSGLLLLVTAGLYFTKSFKDSTCTKRRRYKHAVVQTSPKTSLVAHGVQMGVNGSSTNYRSTHTTAETVQPQDQTRVSETPVLDPSGRKRMRYSSPDSYRRGSPQDARQDRSPDRPSSRYDERDGDRYDNRQRERRDSYERDRRGSYDRGESHYAERDRGRQYDVESERDRRYHSRDRYEDRSSPRDTSRETPHSPRYQERDHHKDQPSGRQQRDRPGSGREKQPSPSKEEPVKKEAPPVKPTSEPPPLKELPPQASEALKKSAAADLVKQVSSGSPVLTSLGSAPSGMPNKLEKKAATMANPYEKSGDRPVSTNPFDEPDEDEYFD